MRVQQGGKEGEGREKEVYLGYKKGANGGYEGEKKGARLGNEKVKERGKRRQDRGTGG